MATPVHAPRVNNNDDVVKLISLDVQPGQQVSAGQLLAQVETDKAIVDVESPAAGYVLGWQAEADTMVAVGAVLLWLGEHADEPMPRQVEAEPEASVSAGNQAPTGKARLLLLQHGLQASDVPASGERLSADDVLRYVAKRAGASSGRSERARIEAPKPSISGSRKPLSGAERGMLQTVSWSRDFAVPGYLEFEYDATAWEGHAKAWGEARRLIMSPLMSLMAWRLVALARETPMLNATIVDGERLEYDSINLGSTVQAGDTLYLAVLRDTQADDEEGFVHRMGEIQRRAMKHELSPDELSGATISFSSMSRWKISRHIPVLPPHTALIVAHAQSRTGTSVLGATYDHRVLNGFQVAQLLRKLATPPNGSES